MSKDWQSEIQALLNIARIGFLATQGEQSPETSMCPYAMYQGDIVLHLSDLAKHSKNIMQSHAVGFMICTPEPMNGSPLALPRMSFTGVIQPISNQDKANYQQAYIQHIPDAQPLFSFADFRLYKLEVDSVFFVGGFGQARKVSLADWLKVTEVVAK